jgi:amino acid adenylation domain-containing protein
VTQLTRYGRMLAAAEPQPSLDGAPPQVLATLASQHALWPASCDPEQSAAMVEAVSLRFDGVLDIDALHAALNDLLARHDALRARFTDDGESMLLPPQALLDLLLEDLTGLPALDCATRIAELTEDALSEPFDLQRDLLLRACLLRVDAVEHRLLLIVHRLVCDRDSLPQLVEDLGALYAARVGLERPLPVARSWLEHVRALPASEDAGSAGRGRSPAATLLPTDRPRSRHPAPQLSRRCQPLPPGALAALDALAQTRGHSRPALLAAALAVLLYRLGGEAELHFALRIGGDGPRPVGPLETAWPLHLRIDPARAFVDLFDDIAARLQRRPTATPPASSRATVSLAIHPGFAACADAFPGLHTSADSEPRRRDAAELGFALVGGGDGVRLECLFQSALFESATIGHWLDAFAELLTAIVRAPQSALGRLPLLGERARACLDAWQPPLRELPDSGWLHRSIEAVCQRQPRQPALSCVDGQLDYAALASDSRRLARAMQARGVGPGSRVGLCLQRGRDLVPAMLAVLRCGAAYVPLDPGFPAERLDFMVRDAELALVLSSRELLDSLRLPATPRLLLDADREAIAAEDDGPLDLVPEAADPWQTPAYVIYTSGSTGKPKGVVVPHAAVANFLHAMAETPGLSANERLVAVTTLSFDIAVLELLLPLVVGAEVILASREQVADGRELRRLIESRAANVLQATPAAWRLLLDAGFEPTPGFRAFCGGEALPADLAARLGAAGVELWNLYGPTETTVWSTCWQVQPRERGIAIGRPIRNTHVRVLDAHGEQCPVGVTGEICIGGDGVSLGYLGRAELTADRFVIDPFLPPRADGQPRRLYRTGDRGRWCSDGLLEHQGRFDHQVKLRGYRIELGEIETRLTVLDGVARSLVLVREDRPGDQRLVAYVVPAPGMRCDPLRLRASLRRFLPEYMVPQHVVLLEQIPRLPNGKTDRAALPPPLAVEATAGAHVAPPIGTRPPAPTAGDAPIPVEHVPVEHIPVEHGRRSAPLSPDQSRLWLLQSLHPNAVAYNTPSAHRLRGSIDCAAFERAFAALLRRQPSLRTAIERDAAGQLRQVIHDADALLKSPALAALFPAEDLRGHSEDEREAELQRRMQLVVDAPFDLTRAPLFRARMYRLADDEHALLFVPHDIVWDGWSFDLFVEEMAALYAAEIGGVEPDLPALPIGYGDYAAWHARWLQGSAYAEQRDFWRERIAARPPPLPLPADRQRRGGTFGRGGSDWVRIPGWLTESLRELARDARTTVVPVLLAAYAILIARLSGSPDVVIATPLRGRSHEQIAPLMGQFTKLLPLAIRVDPAQDFRSLLRQVRDTVQQCFGHPDIQLEDLLAALPTPPGSTRPLYQALFSLQDIRQWPRRWGNLRHEPIQVVQQGATEDFGLWLVEHAEGLSGAVMFNAEHFDRATATLFRDQYLSLIAQLAERPQETIGALARPAPFERDRLAGWSHGRSAPEVGGDSLTARFRRLAAQQPQLPAVIEGSRSHSYRVLARAVAAAACHLRACTEVGDVIAIALPHGVHRLAAVLGGLSVGGVCLLLDPAQPAVRLAACLDALPSQRGVRHWLLAEPALAQVLRWPSRQRIDPRRLRQPCDARQELLRTPACSRLLLAFEDANGETSLASVAERSLLALDSGLREHGLFRSGARVAVLAGPASPRSLVEGLLPLMVGASVVVDEARQTLSSWLASDDADTVIADAEAWQREFEAGWCGRDGLTTVADGAARALLGEPDPAEMRGRHFHAFGDPRAGLWSLLGGSGAVARVLPARRVRVLDGAGEPCAIGVFGQLRLSVDSYDGAAQPELALGQARWRADGSLELLRGAPGVGGAELPLAAGAATIRTPQSPLQALFHDLWADVLGHNEFGIDDSFFDLGGYSLIAVRMFHQAEQQTGVNLPLATLYRAPTIAALAAAFAAAGSRVSDSAVRPNAIPVAEDIWRPLVPIRPAGRQRPLFLIHAVGGNVMNYRVLARALPADLPVYGLQAVGLDGLTAPLTTVEAMAERYVGEIQGKQPQGPYRIGGGSMGGVIAFEVARRLRARGESVELLAMFDSDMPQRRDALAVGLPPQRLGDRLRGLLDTPPASLRRRLQASLQSRAQALLDRLRVVGCRMLRRPLPHSIRYRYLERISLLASQAYHPGPYDGELTLFLASDGRSGRDFDPTLGWGAVAGARVRVVPVGGTHEDLISRASLAAALAAAIEACAGSRNASPALPPTPPSSQPGSSA